MCFCKICSAKFSHLTWRKERTRQLSLADENLGHPGFLIPQIEEIEIPISSIFTFFGPLLNLPCGE